MMINGEMVNLGLVTFHSVGASHLLIGYIQSWRRFNGLMYKIIWHNPSLWKGQLFLAIQDSLQKYRKNSKSKDKHQNAKTLGFEEPEDGYKFHGTPKLIIKQSILIQQLGREFVGFHIFRVHPLGFFESLTIVKPCLQRKTCAKENPNNNAKVLLMNERHEGYKGCNAYGNNICKQSQWMQKPNMPFYVSKVHLTPDFGKNDTIELPFLQRTEPFLAHTSSNFKGCYP
jgi:hypothetical protein